MDHDIGDTCSSASSLWTRNLVISKLPQPASHPLAVAAEASQTISLSELPSSVNYDEERELLREIQSSWPKHDIRRPIAVRFSLEEHSSFLESVVVKGKLAQPDRVSSKSAITAPRNSSGPSDNVWGGDGLPPASNAHLPCTSQSANPILSDDCEDIFRASDVKLNNIDRSLSNIRKEIQELCHQIGQELGHSSPRSLCIKPQLDRKPEASVDDGAKVLVTTGTESQERVVTVDQPPVHHSVDTGILAQSQFKEELESMIQSLRGEIRSQVKHSIEEAVRSRLAPETRREAAKQKRRLSASSRIHQEVQDFEQQLVRIVSEITTDHTEIPQDTAARLPKAIPSQGQASREKHSHKPHSRLPPNRTDASDRPRAGPARSVRPSRQSPQPTKYPSQAADRGTRTYTAREPPSLVSMATSHYRQVRSTPSYAQSTFSSESRANGAESRSRGKPSKPQSRS
ncbi:uncharacterized protein BJ171DRAFT_568751 [Polychytrium aggregatum]|uniref:uncharacterized protein n=1 Tax=Polychytrium aggregatum TaxID=110093 RepID=UPI0022FE2230|nr:uncharacterized protein BJ171DRAFT_568751 [Polychytrium aggregatum]KAI9203628.1 hypothetical protein BJ171DRAFT_568751 [Polychytrium aggregatum]